MRPSLKEKQNPLRSLADGGRCDKQAGVDSPPVSCPDPGAVDLERVANLIVDHSLQDCVFSKEAGRMCYAIIQVGGLAEREAALRMPPQGQAQASQQKIHGYLDRDRLGQVVASTLLTTLSSGTQAESKQAGQSVFRRGLLNRLQKEYDAREQLRACSLQGWVCYVTFICNIFDYLRVRQGSHLRTSEGLCPKATLDGSQVSPMQLPWCLCSPHR